MMKHRLTAAALALAIGVAWGGPALAQGRTLIIYGNDKCPAGTICVRAPEADRYRIPQSLRSGTLAPADQPWAGRAASVANAGPDRGPGPCTNIGGGGGSSCFQNQMRAARAERAQDKAQAAESPVPK